jgi:hypothetical protein
MGVMQDNQMACLRIECHNGTFAFLKDIVCGLHLDSSNLAQSVLDPMVNFFQPQEDFSQHSKYLVEYAKKVHAQVQQHQEYEGPSKSRLRLRILNKVSEEEAEPQRHQEGALIH